MNYITLNQHISLYDCKLAFLQFRYALPMYDWIKSKTGLMLLYPSKKKFILSFFSFDTIFLFIMLLLFMISALVNINFFYIELVGVFIIILRIGFVVRRNFLVYKSLPKHPLVIANVLNGKMIFKRNIPCAQIHTLKQTIDFGEIKSSTWKFSPYLNNMGDIIRLTPLMEFDLNYKGFYLCYIKNGKEVQELFFCGQKINYRTFDKIINICKAWR